MTEGGGCFYAVAMAKKKRGKSQAERERRRAELARRREADEVMLVIAESVLNEPDYRITPDASAAMLRRLIEFLKRELAKRPAHRPAAVVSTGAAVAHLIAAGKSQKAAIGLVTRMRKLTRATVERRWREYRQRKRAAETKA